MTAAPHFTETTSMAADARPVLEIDGLALETSRGGRSTMLVDDVVLSVRAGEALGIVGESGSGKSLTLRAITGLLPPGITQVGGVLRLSDGASDPVEYRFEDVRGRGLAMIFQEPMTALNPTMRVGDLITTGPRIHHGWSRARARKEAIRLLTEVGMPDPERQARMWPHELSGGLRQRVMIAMALATDPRVLLCDEPTTALDVVVQDQILQLLQSIGRDRGLAIVFVTHDLGVVRNLCERVAVMYAGQVVEQGPIGDVFSSPTHPYTAGLLASMPTLQTAPDVELRSIPGTQPDPGDRPTGCRFAPRCPHAIERCASAAHEIRVVSATGQGSSCIRTAELTGALL